MSRNVLSFTDIEPVLAGRMMLERGSCLCWVSFTYCTDEAVEAALLEPEVRFGLAVGIARVQDSTMSVMFVYPYSYIQKVGDLYRFKDGVEDNMMHFLLPVSDVRFQNGISNDVFPLTSGIITPGALY